MGKYDYQQSTRTEQIVFFPKLRAIVPKPNIQKSPKTRALKKKKKKKRGTPKIEISFAGLSVSCNTT